MLDLLKQAKPSETFQNPGSMCCSMPPSGTSGFGKHRLIIRYAEGAEAIDTFGSAGHPSEQETTTLPGARFVILSQNMNGGQHELELLMLPPDQTYVESILN